MKIRIYNRNDYGIKVILEPWAVEFDLETGDYLDFIDEKVLDQSAYFAVEIKEFFISVWPEWQTTNINVFDRYGKKIDW